MIGVFISRPDSCHFVKCCLPHVEINMTVHPVLLDRIVIGYVEHIY